MKGKTQTKNVKFYNLDAIISVGYRVNSKLFSQFRIWATKTLKEHLIKRIRLLMKKDYYKRKDNRKNLQESH